MKQFYIYETTNLINGKKYIGKHIGEINDNYLGSGLLLKKAIDKYGKENFTKKILYIAIDLKELNEKEKEYINKTNAVESDEYYNIHEGGDGGNTIAGWPEERKQTHHELLSEQRKGEKNPRYGQHLSEETKSLIRENRNTKYMQTEEYRKAMSQATSGEKNGMYGKHHTEEAKQKMSQSKKGKYSGSNNPMYGKHHTEEAKQKISEAASQKTKEKNSNHKEVNLYSDSDHIILKYHFNTIQDALEFVGVKPTNYSGVNRAIKANRIYKGYFWEIVKPKF